MNLYDPKPRVIAVYRKQGNGENLFLTTCKLTDIEESHLIESGGNYVTEAVLKNQKALTIINPIPNKNIYDLYLEKRNESMELKEYKCALYHHIFWKSKEQFVLLMENYVHNSIDFEHFKIAFSQLWWDMIEEDEALQMDLKRVENFQLDPRSDGFGSFITSVFRQFEVLEDEECTEQELKDYVRNTIRQIQPYL